MFFIGQVSGLFENFNVWIYSDTVNMINVKLGMMVLLIDLYLSPPLLLTLTMFQSHSHVEQFSLKMWPYPIKLKLCWIVKLVYNEITSIFHWSNVIGLVENLNIGIYSDTM